MTAHTREQPADSSSAATYPHSGPLSMREHPAAGKWGHKGWALGGERFWEQIEALGQRRAVSKGVGRQKRAINPV